MVRAWYEALLCGPWEKLTPLLPQYIRAFRL
jgi:hypothetical protein